MFWFSLQLLSETFLILRRNERDIVINVYWSSFSSSDCNESDFAQDFLKKTSNIIFHEHLSSGSRVVPCGWTDGRDEANFHFTQFLRMNPTRDEHQFPQI